MADVLAALDEELARTPVPEGGDGDVPGPGEYFDLPERLHALRQSEAPLFAPTGAGWRGHAKRALNVVLRVFGRRQYYFNLQLLDALILLLAELRALRQCVERPGGLVDRTRRLERLGVELRAVIDELERHRERLRGVEATQQGQSAWITTLQRKHDMLALETRELAAGAGGARAGVTEPYFPDVERYRRRLDAMGDAIRVNVGCGEKPWPDYINVDARPLPDVDVVADARRLPFEPGSVAELASSHLVEHFREYELRTRVLPHWKSLLRPGGALRIVCPNWGAMLERLQDGRMSLAEFKLLTFGGQDYEGDDHFAMYSVQSLSALLTECGFSRVEVGEHERMNDICPEMELLAYP